MQIQFILKEIKLETENADILDSFGSFSFILCNPASGYFNRNTFLCYLGGIRWVLYTDNQMDSEEIEK